mmetsp:Transcript_41458/g.117297  ORF Transcript_41458/g.117297 Transcript_41458/m.117297 type:complete len:868 (+) Transcript_41458:136-2739(+)
MDGAGHKQPRLTLCLEALLTPGGLLLCIEMLVPPPGLGCWRSPEGRDAREASFPENVIIGDPVLSEPALATDPRLADPAASAERTKDGESNSHRHEDQKVDSPSDRSPATSEAKDGRAADTMRSPWSALCGALESALSSSDLPMARCFREGRAGGVFDQDVPRQSLFPLPLVYDEALEREEEMMVNLCILGLSHLDSGFSDARNALPRGRHSSAAQRSVQDRVRRACRRLRTRMEDLVDESDSCWTPLRGLSSFDASLQSVYPVLVADLVDILEKAAAVDPLSSVPHEVRTFLDDPRRLFPDGVLGKAPRQLKPSGNRAEYTKLTAKLLRCGKLRLRRQAEAAAPVFVVGKRGSHLLRQIWSGHDISLAARRPPKPYRLGNPGVFCRIRKLPGSRLYFSKRDARAFFDQLCLPKCLRKFFGRPAVIAGDLARELELELRELAKWVDDAGPGELAAATTLTPVMACWPMGFSWSSVVAQAVMVDVCRRSGLSDAQLLSLEHAPPTDMSELGTVATDDIILVHDDAERGRERLAKLDAAFVSRGVERNIGKDVDCASEIEALGCHLGNDPPWAEPSLGKLVPLLFGILQLVISGRASPDTFSSMLGTAQWFAQLPRWLFSVFHASYDFARGVPDRISKEVPDSCVNEMLVFFALAPLAIVDLEAPLLPLITACDAAPEFGFGVSVRDTTPEEAAQMAAASTQLDRHIELLEDTAEAPGMRRSTATKLPYSVDSFVDVISLKAKVVQHSGAMEAHGLLLLVQWLARAVGRHGCRVIAAVDAQAVLYAAKKGRSSSPTLHVPLMRISAHCLAAGLQLLLLWVPSSHNPADAPSRGARRRPQVRRHSLKQHRITPVSRLDRMLRELLPYVRQ